jgi:tetratricopeptide (TPR) repeat protein
MRVIRNRRFWLVLGPSLALIVLAIALLPEQASLLSGAAFAWALAATLILRSRVRMEYQAAVRHLRRGEYQQAITIMDALINAEPNSLDHRQFRAQLCLLSGDLQRAAADYEWMLGHPLGLIIGYIGLTEIEMQKGDYDQARKYALAALEQDKGWMAEYELGMIEDRRGDAEAAIKHLEATFASGIPHSRFRLLARLWAARNCHRLGRDDDAQRQLDLMRKETKGLREWRLIFESDQGAVLRGLLEEDVQLTGLV